MQFEPILFMSVILMAFLFTSELLFGSILTGIWWVNFFSPSVVARYSTSIVIFFLNKKKITFVSDYPILKNIFIVFILVSF